ncbi:glycerol-3-phosphate dehydrogenase/oxidase [Oceanobacter mangrovi]|uniref:glycerol-3-phosphate dehydrogenase/oxidase n=1 Tax=Oceanobacter mangrovi TaxID=2862510 RepID=UPI001C8F0C5B|nr:glycerol-3-phosphate dehydrogenase/oxidase [Oceanobacter mangrovi]
MQRDSCLKQLDGGQFDVLIIGGGINGAVAAAALSARGAKVALVERHDIASATSANSSSLVWGGIKYLEQGEVQLVRELCRSRNQLLKSFPNRIREIRFLASVAKGFRKPAWMIWAGAWLYWFLGRGQTRIPALLGAGSLRQRATTVDSRELQGAVEYSDAWLVDGDARFTFDLVKTALKRGAVIASYTRATHFEQHDFGWQVQLQDQLSGEIRQLRSRLVINAAGPWVDQLNQLARRSTQQQHRFSSGLHLIVPRIGDGKQVLAFFASDGRLFFVMPLGCRSCIGTTDTVVSDPASSASDDERQFLLDNANRCLQLPQPLTRDDIIAERFGVRPLAVTAGSAEASSADWQNLSRRHVIEADPELPWLSVFGGKLTDCLNVGEELCELVEQQGIALSRSTFGWYGEPVIERRDDFIAACRTQGLNHYWCEHLQEPLPERWWRRYGDDALLILARVIEHPEELAPILDGDDLRVAEVWYAAEHEYVTTLEDFLRRRTLLEQTLGKAAILQDAGLTELASILFGSQANAQLEAYRQGQKLTTAAGAAGQESSGSLL